MVERTTHAFQIRVRCADCTDVDEQGCFGGGYGWVEAALVAGHFVHDGQHYIVDDGGTNAADAATFEDRALAGAVADEGTRCYDVGPWVFEVVSTG